MFHKILIDLVNRYLSARKRLDPIGFIEFLKADTALVKTFLIENRLTYNMGNKWVRINRKGYPPHLTPIINYISNGISQWECIILMTLVTSYKHIIVPGKLKFHTIYDIQDPDNHYLNLHPIVETIDKQWDSVGFKLLYHHFRDRESDPLININPGFINSGNWQVKGPNGNSLLSRVADLINVGLDPKLCLSLDRFVGYLTSIHPYTVKRTIGESIILSVSGLIKWIGIERLQRLKDALNKERNLNIKNTLNHSIVRRLTYFPDGGGKYRYIALGDWVSQNVLRSLHLILFRILKELPTDLTFDQSKIKKIYLDWYNQGKRIYSLDLTAATDRLPITLQAIVLSKLFNSEQFAKDWIDIIVSKPFFVKDGLEVIPVYYGTGQGMGMYSSWAILAITHHILVKTSAFIVGIDPRTFNDYAILGDDIVIASEPVALKYKEIILSIGVSISEPKCVLPSEFIGIEFASKIFSRGKEFSPLPFGLILEGTSISLFSFWSELSTRVFDLEQDQISDLESLTHAPDLGPLFPISGGETIGTEWAFIQLYNLIYNKLKLKRTQQQSNLMLNHQGLGYLDRWLLDTFGEVWPLQLYHDFNRVLKDRLVSQVDKTFQLIKKNADDLCSVERVIQRDFSKYPTARGELTSIPELTILFGRPYYVLEDDVKDLLDKLGSLERYTNKESVRDLLRSDFINRFEVISKASFGPIRLFSNNYVVQKGGLTRKYKVSRSKWKMIFKHHLFIKTFQLVFPKHKGNRV